MFALPGGWRAGALHWFVLAAGAAVASMLTAMVNNLCQYRDSWADAQRSQLGFAEAEELYRAIVENVDDGVSVFVGNQRHYVNQAFADMHNFENREQALQGPVGSGMADEDRDSWMMDEGAWAEGRHVYHTTGETGQRRTIEARYAHVMVDGRDGWACITRDITEIDRIIEETAENEQHFRALFDSSPIGIVEADPERNIWRANPAAQRIIGRSETELMGARLSDFQTARTVTASGSFEKLAAGEVRDIRYERTLLRPDGAEVTVQVIAAPIRDAEGNLLRVIRMLEDVTEARLTAQRLVASEARFRTLFDTAPVGIAVVDLENVITEVNGAYAQMFNKPPDAVIGTSFGAPFPPESGAWRNDIWAKLVSGELSSITADRPVLDDSASAEWASVGAAVVRDDQGEFLHAVRIVEDITERKRAEESLRQSREELALMNAQNESILRAAGEGIMAFDSAGMTTSVNPAAAEMLGMSAADAINQRSGKHGVLTKADGSAYGDGEHLTPLVLKDGIERHAEGDQLTRVDGSTIFVDRVITPLRNADDTATIGVVMTMRDSTERARMERAKAEFLAMTSHELKTPLTAIHAAVGLIASGALGPLPEKAEALLGTASANSDRLLKLINEIVELERLNLGTSLSDVVPCDTRQMLEEVAAGVGALASASDVTLKVEGDPIRFEADKDRMSQTLLNLVGNAVKFSPPGAEVVLASREVEDGVEFAITDVGPGIPPELADQIFEPFKQVHRSDSRDLGGSGLGLAISKGLVEQHRGRIWVETKQGQGSTFKVVLPLTQPRPS
jgi:two-component system, OmpR family, sensor histidine kinase VicK